MVPQQYFIHDLAGSSEALKKVIESLRYIAPSKLNVLIQGESGTGKEVTVKAIYCNSGLAGHLVPVNCATLPPDLAESELFGHEKGSFTGQRCERTGNSNLLTAESYFWMKLAISLCGFNPSF